MALSSAFAKQVLLEMANIARISTSVQQVVINVQSTPYVLIIWVLTAVTVKMVSVEIHGQSA